MDEIPTADILDAFFMQGGNQDCPNNLVRHQIESMNEFMDKQLLQIIQGFNPIQVCHNYSPELGEFKYKLAMNIINPTMSKPVFQSTDGTQMLLTPHYARMNNLSYVSNLYVDVHVITHVLNDDGVNERHEHTLTGICIGKIPIMIRSKACVLTQMPSIADEHECRYDYGGYFLINGNEKVIISQDRISENKTLVFAPNSNGDGLYAEIRSMPDGIYLPPKTTSLHLSGKSNHQGNIIRLSASFIRTEIPLFVMFRALGIESDKDIYAHIVFDVNSIKNQRMIANLAASSEDACDIHTQQDALMYILKVMGSTGVPREYLDQPDRAIAILQNIIRNDFLAHTGKSFRKKALYLGYMVNKILSIHLGYMDYDNRDSYLNKRIDTPGILFSNLFRQCYGKLIKEVRNLVVRELNLWRANPNMPQQLINQNNIHRFFKLSIIETGLRYALSTGNWGVKTIGSFQNIRQGVAQVLNRMSYLSTLSHLRRINTPMEKNGKLIQPRKLENSQFGMICPSETPEGAAVGLVKNIALSTCITVNSSSVFVRDIIASHGTYLYGDDTENPFEFLTAMGAENAVHIMVNGDLVGYHTEPGTLYNTLKHLKRYGSIPVMTSIVWDVKRNIIMVSTEAGRMCRPLHIVDSNNIRLTKYSDEFKNSLKNKQFQTFIAPIIDDSTEGFIEYMDVDEIDKAMVAMFPRDLKRSIKGTTLPPNFTHCEIYPALINGVLAANIPFMDHNQAPRNCYQCLDIHEPVRLIDGSTKAIKDIVVGDKVICFDPVTKIVTNTTVVHQYIRPAQKQMNRIFTISGRRIIATIDHKFSTNQGWVDTTGFDLLETKLAIYPVPQDQSSVTNVPINLTGLNATDQAVLAALPVSLYSFHTNNVMMSVIARLVGYSVGNTQSPYPVNSTIDQIKFNEDVQSLGFSNGYYNGTYMNLITLLKNNSSIWLNTTNCSRLVIREYISGYLGGISSLASPPTQIPTNIMNLIRSITNTVDPTATNIDSETVMKYFSYAYCLNVQMVAAVDYEYQLYLNNFAYLLDIQQIAGLVLQPLLRTTPMSIDEWRMTVDILGNMLMLPIGPIQNVRHNLVSDITVESNNHSFIGGDGFAVSNSAMGKQAVGIYTSNFNTRIDTMGHVLHYPQKPIVKTKLAQYTNSDSLPSGINAVVAIMTYSGFNQEDSVMVNQSAIDRGLFTSSYYKSYRDMCSKNHSTGEEEFFTKPVVDTDGRVKPFNYEKLGEDGFVPKNTYVDMNDVCVGKVMPHKQHGVVTHRDTSTQIKGNDEGYIDQNYQSVNGDGYKFCKIKLRQYRKPVIGDKVASRSAQKGTIGMTYKQHDMPFSKNGITPDIIMNPHAVPSRMTIGQLMECIMGKAACHLGTYGDSTPFTDCSVEGIANILARSGYERYGNEILYNGRTGQQIQTEIFIGPTYYQRLKHMVCDKMHGRGSSGPLVSLTRQPAEGRARNGGLRFGKPLPKCNVKVVLVLYRRATLSNSGKLSKQTKFDLTAIIYTTFNYNYNMSDIVWKEITQYKNYSVSNTGFIKNNITQRILKPYLRNGYNSINLCVNNVKKTFNIHSIVAQYFLDKPSEDRKYVVNHKDEDKTNNHIDNLEYLTYRENTMYSMTSKRTKNLNKFELSDFIDIPNYEDYMVSKSGDIYSKNLKRLACYTIIPSGYHKIKMKSNNNIYKDLYIHVIVAISYLNYIPHNNYVINHIDGNKGNNNLNNLEIVTQKDNMKHSVIINNDKIFRRGVYYINNDNEKVSYISAKEASSITGIDNSSILKSCKSDNKKAGNIKWRFMSNS